MTLFRPKYVLLAIAVITVISCKTKPTNQTNMAPDSIPTSTLIPAASGFEQAIGGKKVKLFVLKGKNGMQAAITKLWRPCGESHCKKHRPASILMLWPVLMI